MIHLTETTGKVTGKEEVKNFISMVCGRFDVIHNRFPDVDPAIPSTYLLWTLLLNNEIAIFY